MNEKLSVSRAQTITAIAPDISAAVEYTARWALSCQTRRPGRRELSAATTAKDAHPSASKTSTRPNSATG